MYWIAGIIFNLTTRRKHFPCFTLTETLMDVFLAGWSKEFHSKEGLYYIFLQAITVKGIHVEI